MAEHLAHTQGFFLRAPDQVLRADESRHLTGPLPYGFFLLEEELFDIPRTTPKAAGRKRRGAAGPTSSLPNQAICAAGALAAPARLRLPLLLLCCLLFPSVLLLLFS